MALKQSSKPAQLGQLLNLHHHSRGDGVDLVSTRLPELVPSFGLSPEIYHLHYRVAENDALTPLVKRGGHAHRFKKEIFIALFGQAEVLLFDGQTEQSFILKDCRQALYVPTKIWHEVHFKTSCILQVISSTRYSEQERLTDYIEDKELYKKEIKELLK